MDKELKIHKYLDKKMIELEMSGSDKEELEKIKIEAYNALQKENIEIDELIAATIKFLDSEDKNGNKMVSGIEVMISVDDNISINIVGGTNNNNESINENTLFDIASITKFYTLLLTFKLVELGYINLNDAIVDLDPRFKLEDFKVLDLLLMLGEINTFGHIKNAKTKEEAEELLQTAFLKSNDRSKNIYTDMGAIILSKVIETVVNKRYNTSLKYDEIMNKYIFEKLNLKNTTFKPKTLNLAGNGNSIGLVHDPKAKLLGPIGSAGIFTNTIDLDILAKSLFNYEIITRENLLKCGSRIFDDSNKGYMGLYQKQEHNLAKSYTPGLFAEYSFSHQGWTGSVVVFDQFNKIHNAILTNAIPLNKLETHNDKIIGYKDRFLEYQQVVSKISIIMKIVNDYKKQNNERFNFKENIIL